MKRYFPPLLSCGCNASVEMTQSLLFSNPTTSTDFSCLKLPLLLGKGKKAYCSPSNAQTHFATTVGIERNFHRTNLPRQFIRAGKAINLIAS